MKRYYFTDKDGENIMNDHCGNIRGARKKAEQYASEYHVDVYINTMEPDEIIDVILGKNVLN